MAPLFCHQKQQDIVYKDTISGFNGSCCVHNTGYIIYLIHYGFSTRKAAYLRTKPLFTPSCILAHKWVTSPWNNYNDNINTKSAYLKGLHFVKRCWVVMQNGVLFSPFGMALFSLLSKTNQPFFMFSTG